MMLKEGPHISSLGADFGGYQAILYDPEKNVFEGPENRPKTAWLGIVEVKPPSV